MGQSFGHLVIVWLYCLGYLVSAFQLDFWLGPYCTGEPEGQTIVRYKSSQPCFKVPINAESVTVSGGNPSLGTAVAFFKSDNCAPNTRVAFGDAGCVATGLKGNAMSYSVRKADYTAAPDTNYNFSVTDAGTRTLRVRSLPESLQSQKTAAIAEIEARLGRKIEKIGSIHPKWDPERHAAGGFGHGDISEAFGQQWKWQQVALGISIGIRPEEWNDEVHVKNDQFLAFGNPDWFPDYDNNNTLVPRGNLSGDWNSAICQTAINCVLTAVGGENLVTLNNGWQQTVNGIAKLKHFGKTLYDFVHDHPISVQIFTTVAGYGLGYAHGSVATAQDNDQLATCTTTQTVTITQTVTKFVPTGHNFASTGIQLPDGHTLELSAACFEFKSEFDKQCNS